MYNFKVFKKNEKMPTVPLVVFGNNDDVYEETREKAYESKLHCPVEVVEDFNDDLRNLYAKGLSLALKNGAPFFLIVNHSIIPKKDWVEEAKKLLGNNAVVVDGSNFRFLIARTRRVRKFGAYRTYGFPHDLYNFLVEKVKSEGFEFNILSQGEKEELYSFIDADDILQDKPSEAIEEDLSEDKDAELQEIADENAVKDEFPEDAQEVEPIDELEDLE